MGSSFRIPIDIGILPDLRRLCLELRCPRSNALIPGDHAFWLPNSANSPTQIEVLQIIVYSIATLPDSRVFFCNGADDQTTWGILHSETLQKKHPNLRKIILSFDLEIVPAECDVYYGALSLSDLSYYLASDLKVLLAPTDAASTRIDISASLVVVFNSKRSNCVAI
jgi:hypothetical protein